MSLLPQSHALHQGEQSVVGRYPTLQSLPHPPPPPQRHARSSPTPGLDDACLSQRYAQMAWGFLLSSPPACHWLGPGEVRIIGEHPIAAGGFANVWEGTHDGRKVVLKSYRCYLSFDVTNVVARFHNEVRMWTLLHQQDVDVVPLVGVYSVEDHPFCLVYEYVDGLDLRQYLSAKPDVGRLELLVGIAHGLNCMHDLGIVHGRLETANILVDEDGTAWIAGLGNTAVLPHSTAQAVESGTSTDRLCCSHAPESAWPEMPPNLIDPSHPTEAKDMYAFGVLAWEILTGQPPFFEMTGIAAMHSMLNGARPPRPDNHEISDRLWHMIERCWHNVPSKRMSAREAADLLETELRHRPGSHPVPHAELPANRNTLGNQGGTVSALRNLISHFLI